VVHWTYLALAAFVVVALTADGIADFTRSEWGRGAWLLFALAVIVTPKIVIHVHLARWRAAQTKLSHPHPTSN
jgi:hypothetical protein